MSCPKLGVKHLQALAVEAGLDADVISDDMTHEEKHSVFETIAQTIVDSNDEIAQMSLLATYELSTEVLTELAAKDSEKVKEAARRQLRIVTPPESVESLEAALNDTAVDLGINLGVAEVSVALEKAMAIRDAPDDFGLLAEIAAGPGRDSEKYNPQINYIPRPSIDARAGAILDLAGVDFMGETTFRIPEIVAEVISSERASVENLDADVFARIADITTGDTEREARILSYALQSEAQLSDINYLAELTHDFIVESGLTHDQVESLSSVITQILGTKKGRYKLPDGTEQSALDLLAMEVTTLPDTNKTIALGMMPALHSVFSQGGEMMCPKSVVSILETSRALQESSSAGTSASNMRLATMIATDFARHSDAPSEVVTKVIDAYDDFEGSSLKWWNVREAVALDRAIKNHSVTLDDETQQAWNQVMQRVELAQSRIDSMKTTRVYHSARVSLNSDGMGAVDAFNILINDTTFDESGQPVLDFTQGKARYARALIIKADGQMPRAAIEMVMSLTEGVKAEADRRTALFAPDVSKTLTLARIASDTSFTENVRRAALKGLTEAASIAREANHKTWMAHVSKSMIDHKR